MVFFRLMASRAPSSLNAHYPSPSVQDHFCSEFYLEPFQTLFCIVLPFHAPKRHVSPPTHAPPPSPRRPLPSPLSLGLDFSPSHIQVLLSSHLKPCCRRHADRPCAPHAHFYSLRRCTGRRQTSLFPLLPSPLFAHSVPSVLVLLAPDST